MAAPSPGTTDENEDKWPATEWEVMHVVRNTYDPTDDEHLMVMVPGVDKWQVLDAFTWGARVPEQGDLK